MFRMLLLIGLCLSSAAEETPSKERQQVNLMAFSRLYGYIRYFHPSDEASEIDWSKLAIYGAEKARYAVDDRDLQIRLEQLFLPVAPTMRLYQEGEEVPDAAQVLPDDVSSLMVVGWRHLGLSHEDSQRFASARSNRENWKLPRAKFGNIMQVLDAKPYQGKRIRLSVDLRAQVEHNGTAQAWLRVDRAKNKQGFFDNMSLGPSQMNSWNRFSIEGDVAYDATRIAFGGFLLGHGRILLDNFQISYLNNDDTWQDIPFPNSDFESAQDDPQEIPEWYTPMAGVGYSYSLVPRDANGQCVAVESKGISVMVEPFEELPPPETSIHKKLTDNLHLKMLVTLYSDQSRTLGGDKDSLENLQRQLQGEHLHEMRMTRNDVRLGTAIMAWNKVHHFHPEYNPSPEDAEALLKQFLDTAKPNSSEEEFAQRLRKVMAQIDDPGAYASSFNNFRRALPAFKVGTKNNKIIVTYSEDRRIRPGDQLLQVEGKDVGVLFNELMTEYAGSPQRRKQIVLQRMLDGLEKTEVSITFLRNGQSRTLTFLRTETYNNRRFDQLEQVSEDVYLYKPIRWRFDSKKLEGLDNAKGLIIDLRYGIPPYTEFIGHFIKEPIQAPTMLYPKVIMPDREEIMWQETSWQIQPQKPYLNLKRVFIVDATTEGDAEIFLHLVRRLNLGEIVGQRSAGAPGLTNLFTFPAGFKLGFSATKVRFEDELDLYRKGVEPTVLITDEDLLKESKDIFLEKALALFDKPANK